MFKDVKKYTVIGLGLVTLFALSFSTKVFAEVNTKYIPAPEVGGCWEEGPNGGWIRVPCPENEESVCVPNWESISNDKKTGTTKTTDYYSDITFTYTGGKIYDRHIKRSDFNIEQTRYYYYKKYERKRERDTECGEGTRYDGDWFEAGKTQNYSEDVPQSDLLLDIDVVKDYRFGAKNWEFRTNDNHGGTHINSGMEGSGIVTYKAKVEGKGDKEKEIGESSLKTYWVEQVQVIITNPRFLGDLPASMEHTLDKQTTSEIRGDYRNEDDQASTACRKYYGDNETYKSCSTTTVQQAQLIGNVYKYPDIPNVSNETHKPFAAVLGSNHELESYVYYDQYTRVYSFATVTYYYLQAVNIRVASREEYVDKYNVNDFTCEYWYHTSASTQYTAGSGYWDYVKGDYLDTYQEHKAANVERYSNQIVNCKSQTSIINEFNEGSHGTNRTNTFTGETKRQVNKYNYIRYEFTKTGSRSGRTRSDEERVKISYPRNVVVYDHRDSISSSDLTKQSKYSQTYVLYQRPKNGNEQRDSYGINCYRDWNIINDNNGNPKSLRTDNCENSNYQSSALGSTANPRNGTSPYIGGRMHSHNNDGNHLNDVPLGNQSHYWTYAYVDKWNWINSSHKVNYLGVREVIVKLPSEETSKKADEKIVERYVTDTHKNGFDRTPSTSNNHDDYLWGSSYTDYKKESYSKPTCYVYFTSGLINAYVNQNGGNIGSGDLGFKSNDGVGDLTNGDSSTSYIKRSCQNSLQIDRNYDSSDETHSLVTGSRANNARPLHFLPSSNSYQEYNSSYKSHMNSKNNFKPEVKWSKWDLGEPYRLEDYYYMDNSYDSNASAIYIHSMVSDIKITYPAASEAENITLNGKQWKKTYQDKPYGNYSCKYAYAPTIGKGGVESYGGGYVKVTDCLNKTFIQSDSGQNMSMDSTVGQYNNSRKISYNYVNNNYDDRYYEARIYANSTKIMFGVNHPKGDNGKVIPNNFEDEDITGSRTNYRCKVTWQDNVDWANNGQEEITFLENSLSTTNPNYSKIWYSTYLGERFDYIGIGWKDGYVDLSGTRHKPQNINQFYPVDPTGKTYYINCDYPHNTYDNNLDGKPAYVKDNYAPGKDKVKFDVLGIQKLEVFDYPSNAISNPGSGIKAVDTNSNSSDLTPFHFVKDSKGKTYETGHWYNFNAKVTFAEDNTGNQKVQWLNDSTLKEKNWRYGYKTSSPNVIPTSIDKTKLYLGNCITTYANNGSLECPYPSHITSRTSMKFTGHDHRLPYDSGDTNKWNTIRIDYFSEGPIPTGNPEIKSKTYEEVILWSHRPIDLIIEGKSVVDYGDTENYLMKKAWSDGKSQTNHQLNDPLDETNRYVGKNNNPYLNDSEEKSETINPTTPNQAIYWETDATLNSQNNVNPATVKFADFQGDNTKRTIYAYWGDKNRLQSGYDFWDYLYKEKVVTVNFDCSIEFKTVVQGCPIHDSLTVDGVEVDNWRFPDALQLELNYIYTMPFQVTGVAKGSGN